MSRCIICGREASPEFTCVKRDMTISLCEEHAGECRQCEVKECERCPSA